MSDKLQQVSAFSYFNYAIIKSNIVAKEEHTKHIMLCTALYITLYALYAPL